MVGCAGERYAFEAHVKLCESTSDVCLFMYNIEIRVDDDVFTGFGEGRSDPLDDRGREYALDGELSSTSTSGSRNYRLRFIFYSQDEPE